MGFSWKLVKHVYFISFVIYIVVKGRCVRCDENNIHNVFTSGGVIRKCSGMCIAPASTSVCSPDGLLGTHEGQG